MVNSLSFLGQNNDKLVVTRNGEDFSDEKIEQSIEFQEKYFKHVILRKSL